MGKKRLIVFTRYPVPGSTKTRLIPALGPEGAADLQRRMTEHTLERVGPLKDRAFHLQVRFEGADAGAMRAWLGKDLSLEPQGEGDLGERMRRAFQESFSDGFEVVVLVGTDCPALEAGDVEEAVDLLRDNTLVLGPATDGGYYLIGMVSDSPPWLMDLLFTGIPWGTGQVLNETMNALAETGLDVGLLDEKTDVDVPEDLGHWDALFGAMGEGPGATTSADLTLSVIIPVLNEEDTIGTVLESLEGSGVEIVVVDGGSTDRTVAICEGRDVRVIRSERGRARQMNTGAMAATGGIFLFLHADTFLPEGFAAAVRQAIGGGAAAGAFLFGADLSTPSMNAIENMAHFRSIRLGIVLGDQAIFATREAFFRAGAFPEQPLMEDYELWKALGRVGRRSLIPLAVTTSARRWTEHGVWRTTFLHQAVMWLYLLGMGPERLDRWYRKKMKERDKRPEIRDQR